MSLERVWLTGRRAVTTSAALATTCALQTSLEALAIRLLASRTFATAPLEMTKLPKFTLESFGIASLDFRLGLGDNFAMFSVVETILTCTV